MTTTDNTMAGIAEFARERIPQLRWSDDDFFAWLEWYSHHGLLVTIRSPAGQVLAFSAARPSTRESAANLNSIVWDGDVMAVDFIAAATPVARVAVWDRLCSMLGARRWIAFARARYEDRPSFHPFDRFNRAVHNLPL